MKKIIFVLILVLVLSVFATSVLAADGSSGGYDAVKFLFISLAVGLVVGLIVTGVMWAKLKSVHYKRDADGYIKEGSMKLLRTGDFYLYSTVTRTARPKNNSKR